MSHLTDTIYAKFCKILRFFNLVDRNCNLSITNIAVIVLITKMAIAPFDWATAAGLLVTLINYSHKRYANAQAEKAAADAVTNEQVSSVQAIVDQIRTEVDAKLSAIKPVEGVDPKVVEESDTIRMFR